MRQTKHCRNYIINTLFPSLLFGGTTGIITGIIIYFFKYAAEFLTIKSRLIYEWISENMIFLPLLFVGLIFLAVIMALIIKFIPEAKGGGIPRTEGILKGLIPLRWFLSFIGTVFSSFVGFFAGLPLGIEGPSVQIGTSIGKGTQSLFPKKKASERYIMTGGAAAGFSIATGTTLAGIIFVLEEIHKKFSPTLLLVAFSGVLFASATTQALAFALGTPVILLDLGIIATLPIKYIYFPVLLGIAEGLLACLFNSLIKLSNNFFEDRLAKVPRTLKLIALFLLVGITGLFLADALGGGYILIFKIAGGDIVWQILLILLVVKIILIVFSSGAGATGGMFFPLLALGAIAGGLTGKLFICLGMEEVYYKTIVVIGMCAFLGSSMRAPITAMVFIVEATGNLNNFLYTGIAVFIAFFIAVILNVEPLNDMLMNNLLKKQDDGNFH